MKKYGPKECALGVMVTTRAVHAVLLREGMEGPEVVRRFRRQRNARYGEMPSSGDGSGSIGGDADGQDFSIQFGEPGAGGADLFLGSEFADLQSGAPGDLSASDHAATTSFELELTDILSECSDIGYPNPLISFCVPNTELTTVELRVPAVKRKSDRKRDEDKQKEAKQKEAKQKEAAKKDATKKEVRKEEERAEKASKVEKAQLIGLLGDNYEGDIEEECVVFIPMTPTEEGLARFMAVVPHPNDPITLTLGVMRERKSTIPAARVMDAEMALYMGLARAAHTLLSADLQQSLGPNVQRKTLIVRAGLEDTLVMFLSNGVLQHYESLRSITTYDAPETICSRVLLLQDEYGVGDVEHVLLMGDEREEALVESFQLFFPDTRVESLRSYLPSASIDDEGNVSVRPTILATIAALRLAKDDLYRDAFEAINMLPKRLLRRQFKMPVSWHVFALYGVLFATVLFFVARYFTQEHELDLYRYRLQEYPAELTESDPKVLQGRIDSLRQASEGYMRALNVLDSLLVGSDRWSRAMENTSDEVAEVTGLWIERWQPRGHQLELIGNATSRTHVVNFAERIGGNIETLTFSEIREWPVYAFRMILPLPNELPEAARYLRQNVVLDDPAAPKQNTGTPQ